MKHVRYPLLSILFLLLTLEPFRQTWAAWVMFMPLMVLILRSPEPIRDALFGWAVGAVFITAGLFWASVYDTTVLWKIVLIASIPYGLFFGLLSVASTFWKPRDHITDLLVASCTPAVLWILLWMLLGRTPAGPIMMEVPFYQSLPLMQVLALTGMPGLLFCILFFTTTAALWVERSARLRLRVFQSSIILVLVLFLGGMTRLIHSPRAVEGIPVALVQTNLRFDDNWRDEHGAEILATYVRLTEEAAQSQPSIIVFPQYSIPVDVLRDPEFISVLASRTNAYIILASYVPYQEGGDVEDGFSNMGFVFSPTEGLIGEYTSVVGPPFREGDQEFGDTYPELSTPAGRVGLLLCYEDTVRWVADNWMKQEVDALVVVTNPGTFESAALPIYHLQQDVIRAIENNRPVIRVTPNGYSAVIDPLGRIRAQSELHTQQIVQSFL